jgi:hypothetical protein
MNMWVILRASFHTHEEARRRMHADIDKYINMSAFNLDETHVSRCTLYSLMTDKAAIIDG